MTDRERANNSDRAHPGKRQVPSDQVAPTTRLDPSDQVAPAERPDPDELLARIKEAESASEHPRLKIFLGMCAGVGKTWAMLQEARSAIAEGVDLAVGLVETHGRPDTEALLEGLEILPRRTLSYRGIAFSELDIDAVIERKPAVAIVDELAHTNVPGSRHVKRWQDVLELLDRGIDVWTAVNVQHMDSLADVVEDLAGVPVGERVPDTVFDRADEVRLIDLAPEDLIARLREGKVYTGEYSSAAVEGFFRPRNLGILRELALRFAARTASRRLQAYANTESGAKRGAAARTTLGERILVAVGPSPSSAYLVRWARRTSYALRSDWIALHVEDGVMRSSEDRARIEANLALARKLGAETLVVQGTDIAEAIIGTARERGASMIVIGRSGLSLLGPFPRRATVSDRIVREAGSIDVAVVQDASAPRADLTFPALRRFFAAPPRQYALLVVVFAAITGFGFLAAPRLGYRSVAMLYLGAVVALSFLAKPGPVAATAALSALTLNFLFIPPLYTFSIGSPEDWVLFAAYFLVASVTGSLVSRLHSNQALISEREARAAFLFGAAQRLAECRSAEEAAAAAASLVEEHFGAAAVVFVREDLPDNSARGADRGGLDRHALGAAAGEIDQREYAAAAYSFANLEICGASTDSLPESRLRYVPAAAREKAVGVIGLVPPAGRVWTRSDDNLLLSLGKTLAVSIERSLSEARGRRAALELESERLGRILLDSVSHELRTPLTTITGSITALGEDSVANDPRARRELLAGALEASDRLDGIVEDLLSLSRIESGMLRLTRRLADLADIARAAIDGAGPQARGREIRVALPEDVRAALVDAPLVGRLVANLLRNAASYSPAGTPIDLSFEEVGADLAVIVRDYGPGIPDGEIEPMFEKFRRGPAGPSSGVAGGIPAKAATPGLGLGLAICRGIARAHGGTVIARNVPHAGLEVTATFPSCVPEEAKE
jgi:two-component system sensor histidine kinase KdpD